MASKWRRVYLIALTAKEAARLAADLGMPTLRAAQKRLADLRVTDKRIAALYRVYTVKLPADKPAR